MSSSTRNIEQGVDRGLPERVKESVELHHSKREPCYEKAQESVGDWTHPAPSAKFRKTTAGSKTLERRAGKEKGQ